MKGKIILTLLAILVFSFGGFAQEPKKLEKANKEYERFAYVDAQKIFKKVAEDGYKSADLFQKLGNSYYFNANYSEAVKWYEQLFINYEKEVSSEYFFRYAQSLKAVESYEESDKFMQKFYDKENKDTRAVGFKNTPDYLNRIDFQSGKYKVLNLKANSNFSDFGPAYYGENLVFASSRDTGSVSKRLHTWNDMPFLDLFKGKINDQDNDVTAVKGMSSILNTKFHESTPVFTKDLKTVYFTRNNYNKGVYGKAKNGINMLKIYRSTRASKSEAWSTPESLSINSDEYVTAHPTLNGKEDKLYFSSNMPGGEGLSDIYVVDLKADGGIGTPKNLGPQINTEGVESFPFIGKNSNDLYFASNGHVGLGGLDIFIALLEDDDTINGEVVNIGEPANSPDDDFAFIINEADNTGYLSSNRAGGKGDDDIYKFTQIAPLERFCYSQITGVVSDKVSGEILPGSKVVLFDTDNKEIDSSIVGADAAYDFKVNCGKNYFLRADKETYETNEKLVKTPEKSDVVDAPLALVKELIAAETGKDLGKILNLNPIYFDFDKFNIREDAAVELAKVIQVLKEYPKMKIDVRSHTDSRGNDEYNRILSDNRVKSTMKYIIQQGGIAEDRLTGKGYGEAQLINSCSNGVNCSLDQHQLNRRSEFIILEQ